MPFSSIPFLIAAVLVALYVFARRARIGGHMSASGQMAFSGYLLVIVLWSVASAYLAYSGAYVSETTLAVFVSVPAVVAVTSMTMLTPGPLGSVPRLQVTTPPDSSHDPCGVVTDTNVNPAGKVSVTTTFCAASGPLLSTPTV